MTQEDTSPKAGSAGGATGSGELRQAPAGRADAAPPASFGRDLTTGSIPRHLIAFSLPMLAGTTIQTLYSVVNAFWVGQYLGKNGLAAVTVSFPVIFVLIALGAGLTLATSILVSQHYGARDLDAVRRVVNSSTVLLGFLSLALMVAGELLAGPILRLMGTDEKVLPMAEGYLRIYLLTLPMGFGLFLTRSMLQGIGDSITPVYFQAGALVVNAALDPVLMLGWLGMPALGLNGAAWASFIAQTAAIVLMVGWLRRRGNLVALAFGLKRFDWPTALTTMRIGVPAALQQSLISVGMAFVIGIVNGFGESATAAYGAATRVDQFAFMPALTFSLAIATMAGQNIGAGRHHRIREVFLWGCLLSGGITLACSAVAVALPRLLLRVFTNDGTVIDLGAGYLQTVGACYLFFAIMFVSNGVINGSGHTLVTTLISLVSLWIVRVPVAIWLSRRLGRVDGVWYAIAGSFGVSMVASLAYYFSGLWRRPVAGKPIPPSPAAAYGEETGEA